MKPRRTQFWKEVFASCLAGVAQSDCYDEWLLNRAISLADKAQAMLDEEAARAKKLRGTVKA